MQMEPQKLRAFMRARGLTQAALAKQARVSQSTVSRALSKSPLKHSDAHRRLCLYAGLENAIDKDSTAKGINLVHSAFEKIWDGSDAHAVAVAKIIEALGTLRSPKE